MKQYQLQDGKGENTDRRQNNMLLKTKRSSKKSKEKSGNNLRQMKTKTTFPNVLRCSKPGRREKFIASHTYLKEQEKKISKTNLINHLMELEKRTNKLKVSRRTGIIRSDQK